MTVAVGVADLPDEIQNPLPLGQVGVWYGWPQVSGLSSSFHASLCNGRQGSVSMVCLHVGQGAGLCLHCLVEHSSLLVFLLPSMLPGFDLV